MMLLAQTFRKLMVLVDMGSLPALPEDLIHESIPLVMTQALHRTLHWQQSDGSWNDGNVEISAYALLTICSASQMPWTSELEKPVHEAVKRGQQFLMRSSAKWGNINHLWVEKVTYGSSVLCKAYCLAASKAATNYVPPKRAWSSQLSVLLRMPSKRLSQQAAFFSGIPLFEDEKDWKICASLIEGQFFLPYLQRARLEIFPRENMNKDEYLEYIPFTWISCSNKGAFLDSDLLLDMMIVSMLNYQADEYMETVAGVRFPGDLNTVQCLVQSLFTNGDMPVTQDEEGVDTISKRNQAPQADTSLDALCIAIKSTLNGFKTHIMLHPAIQYSSRASRAQLSLQFERFLLAHQTHSTDNVLFSAQAQSDQQLTYPTTNSFWDWVHSTAAIHTSCPYSWSWIACRIESGDCLEPFPTPTAKYLAQDLGAHLSTMCRMYNDYGSIARDKDEKNLNSVNFPEFENRVPDSGLVVFEKQRLGLEERKRELFDMAEYERSCVESAKERLFPLLRPNVREILNVFVNVTDLYGQIYVARDIASRM
jgi:hypothetical protein